MREYKQVYTPKRGKMGQTLKQNQTLAGVEDITQLPSKTPVYKLSTLKESKQSANETRYLLVLNHKRAIELWYENDVNELASRVDVPGYSKHCVSLPVICSAGWLWSLCLFGQEIVEISKKKRERERKRL